MRIGIYLDFENVGFSVFEQKKEGKLRVLCVILRLDQETRCASSWASWSASRRRSARWKLVIERSRLIKNGTRRDQQ